MALNESGEARYVLKQGKFQLDIESRNGGSRGPELQAICDVQNFSQGQNTAWRRRYDADWFCAALTYQSIADCIPSKANSKVPVAHAKVLYRQRQNVENVFAIYIAAIDVLWIIQ